MFEAKFEQMISLLAKAKGWPNFPTVSANVSYSSLVLIDLLEDVIDAALVALGPETAPLIGGTDFVVAWLQGMILENNLRILASKLDVLNIVALFVSLHGGSDIPEEAAIEIFSLFEAIRYDPVPKDVSPLVAGQIVLIGMVLHKEIFSNYK